MIGAAAVPAALEALVGLELDADPAAEVALPAVEVGDEDLLDDEHAAAMKATAIVRMPTARSRERTLLANVPPFCFAAFWHGICLQFNLTIVSH